MNNVLELAKTDYEILEFINRNGSALPEVIQDNFHKIEKIEYRIRILRDSGYIAQDCDKLINGISIKATDTKSFHLTQKGLMVLQNYATSTAKSGLRFWLPLIISNLIALAALVTSIISVLQ